MNNNVILHECVIDCVSIIDSALILNFNGGVYIKDKISDGVKLIPHCSVNIKIDDLAVGREYEHIEICLFHRRKRKYIDFDKFSKLVKEKKFKVCLDFYSDFAAAMLLKGTISPYEIEVTVSEIADISVREEKNWS